jgi:type IV pilus assembly protein PilF
LQLFDSAGAEQAFVRSLSMDRTNTIALLETALLRYEAADYDAASRYYGSYRSLTRQQSPRGLWLGIRLAKATGDRNAESSYILALSNLYPKSAEYEAYRRGQQRRGQQDD